MNPPAEMKYVLRENVNMGRSAWKSDTACNNQTYAHESCVGKEREVFSINYPEDRLFLYNRLIAVRSSMYVPALKSGNVQGSSWKAPS